jgi:hypothetical protein
VSCTSASACTAVGDYNNPSAPSGFAQSWDGTTWTIQPTPIPGDKTGGQLFGVSCTSASACTAVGVAYDNGILGSERSTLAERYS